MVKIRLCKQAKNVALRERAISEVFCLDRVFRCLFWRTETANSSFVFNHRVSDGMRFFLFFFLPLLLPLPPPPLLVLLLLLRYSFLHLLFLLLLLLLLLTFLVCCLFSGFQRSTAFSHKITSPRFLRGQSSHWC